jgi:hypothetical protein
VTRRPQAPQRLARRIKFGHISFLPGDRFYIFPMSMRSDHFGPGQGTSQAARRMKNQDQKSTRTSERRDSSKKGPPDGDMQDTERTSTYYRGTYAPPSHISPLGVALPSFPGLRKQTRNHVARTRPSLHRGRRLCARLPAMENGDAKFSQPVAGSVPSVMSAPASLGGQARSVDRHIETLSQSSTQAASRQGLCTSTRLGRKPQLVSPFPVFCVPRCAAASPGPHPRNNLSRRPREPNITIVLRQPKDPSTTLLARLPPSVFCLPGGRAQSEPQRTDCGTAGDDESRGHGLAFPCRHFPHDLNAWRAKFHATPRPYLSASTFAGHTPAALKPDRRPPPPICDGPVCLHSAARRPPSSGLWLHLFGGDTERGVSRGKEKGLRRCVPILHPPCSGVPRAIVANALLPCPLPRTSTRHSRRPGHGNVLACLVFFRWRCSIATPHSVDGMCCCHTPACRGLRAGNCSCAKNLGHIAAKPANGMAVCPFDGVLAT